MTDETDAQQATTSGIGTTYKHSQLYLNYAVSDRLVKMIRDTTDSLYLMGYKFVPDCDEGRDIFLSLHQLGIRCTREQRRVKIVIALDCRSGPSTLYKNSNISGLDWLASLGQLYPMLNITVAKVNHFGRDTLHAKAVVADGLTLLKSGEGSSLNDRHGNQREDGMLFSSHDIAQRTRKIITQNVCKRQTSRQKPRAIAPIKLPQPIVAPPILTTTPHDQTFSIEAFARLKRHLDIVSNLTSADFHAQASYQELKDSLDQSLKDITSLRQQGATVALQTLYHNHQDALLARLQWIEMMLAVERELVPISLQNAKRVIQLWETGVAPEAIAQQTRLGPTIIKAAISRYAIACQKKAIEHLSAALNQAMKPTPDLTPTIVEKPTVATEATIATPEQRYAQLCQQLKEFVQQLPEDSATLTADALQRSQFFLTFEHLWQKLMLAFDQLKQTTDYASARDLTEDLLLQDFEQDQYGRLDDFWQVCGPEVTNTYRAAYDKWTEELGDFNDIVARPANTCALLHQTASYPTANDAVYKRVLREKVSTLQEKDIINIAVSNLNDADILAELKAACNRGVIVRIAIGKYMNCFYESLDMGSEGSNARALEKLLGSIEPQHQKNLQVRWLVFSQKGQRTIGSEKHQVGTHRKYLSVHHAKSNDQDGDRHHAFLGSSPLDRQAQAFSEELDMVIDDAAQIKAADQRLFLTEYGSGIEMHFCLAIDCLRKAGFSTYADLQEQRYLSEISLNGQDEKMPHRKAVSDEVGAFIKAKLNTNALPKTQQTALNEAQRHMKNLQASFTAVCSISPEPTVTQCLNQLAEAIESYQHGKTWPNKTYLSLARELGQEKTVESIRQKVSERIQQQTGHYGQLHHNSFAVCLVRTGFFNQIGQQLSDADILQKLHEQVINPFRDSKRSSPTRS